MNDANWGRLVVATVIIMMMMILALAYEKTLDFWIAKERISLEERNSMRNPGASTRWCFTDGTVK